MWQIALGISGSFRSDPVGRDVLRCTRDACAPRSVEIPRTQKSGGFGIKHLDPLIERPVKALLLLADGVADFVLFGADFREHIAHVLGQRRDELVKEGFMQPERAPVTHRAAQNAAEHVVAVIIPGQNAVGDGERQGSDVVGDHAECHIDFFLPGVTGASRLWQSGRVFFAAEFLDLVKERAKNVCFIIRDDPAEVGEVFRALNDATDALESRASIDVLGRQIGETAVGIRVELDENEIPDFHALGGAGIDQSSFGVARRSQIDVEFRAGAARPGLAHHPEIVFLVAHDDMDFWVEPRPRKLLRPEIVGFLVKSRRVAGARLVNRGVEAVHRKFPNFRDEFPRPGDRLFFEIIAKTPIPQHLEESVVVGVQPDILEVIVLAARANAFLRVGGSGRAVGTFALAKEDRDKLIHARIGKKEIGRVGHETR